MKPQVFRCWHNGQWKMVGKVAPYRGKTVFLHEESGSQEMDRYDSPGGVDALAAFWLYQNGVEFFYHQNKERCYRARVRKIIALGERKVFDGRDRFFLRTDQWEPCQRISVGRVSPETKLSWEDIKPETLREFEHG